MSCLTTLFARPAPLPSLPPSSFGAVRRRDRWQMLERERQTIVITQAIRSWSPDFRLRVADRRAFASAVRRHPVPGADS